MIALVTGIVTAMEVGPVVDEDGAGETWDNKADACDIRLAMWSRTDCWRDASASLVDDEEEGASTPRSTHTGVRNTDFSDGSTTLGRAHTGGMVYILIEDMISCVGDEYA